MDVIDPCDLDRRSYTTSHLMRTGDVQTYPLQLSYPVEKLKKSWPIVIQ